MARATARLVCAGVAACCIGTSAQAGDVFSGYSLLRGETKAMQDDDFLNPGMEGVKRGSVLFSAAGRNGRSCSNCHGEAGKQIDVKRIARYPVLDARRGQPVTLQQRIIDEWSERLDNPPLEHESDDAVALEAFVRNLARGQVVDVQTDGAMAPFVEQGKRIYEMRIGQLDMACNLCHDDHARELLRAQLMSQGQTNGFPLYRLGTGTLTGIQTRFTECFTAIRAEPYPYGSQEYTLLELYVNARGNGLRIETPAVRF